MQLDKTKGISNCAICNRKMFSRDNRNKMKIGDGMFLFPEEGPLVICKTCADRLGGYQKLTKQKINWIDKKEVVSQKGSSMIKGIRLAFGLPFYIIGIVLFMAGCLLVYIGMKLHGYEIVETEEEKERARQRYSGHSDDSSDDYCEHCDHCNEDDPNYIRGFHTGQGT